MAEFTMSFEIDSEAKKCDLHTPGRSCENFHKDLAKGAAGISSEKDDLHGFVDSRVNKT